MIDYIAEFIDHIHLAKGKRPATAKLYADRIGIFLKFVAKDPDAVIQRDILDFILDLKKKKTTNTTQRAYIAALKSFYGFMRNTYGFPDPSKDILPPKAEMKIPDILTREDVEAMILSVGRSTPLALRNTAILCLLADTGIRVGELVGLRFGHVKREKNQLILDIPSDNKTYRQRRIPFCYFEAGNIIAENFLAYYTVLTRLGIRSEDWLFRSESTYWQKTKDGFRRGKARPDGVHRLTRETVYHIVRKAAEKAGVTKKISPHSLRHFYATYLAVNGLDVYKIKERLGHSSLERTQIYIHYADIVRNDSAKDNPMAGIKTDMSVFTKIIKGENL